MVSITQRRELIYAQVEVLDKQLEDLQEECTHPNVYKDILGQETDKSWTEYDCPDCDKSWSVVGV